MKKLTYFVFLLILVPVAIFGAITGDGSYGSPYTGTLSSGNFTISGTKYFHQIDVSGGTLTVSAGATLYAKATTSYITISSTGVLTADGASGNIITFSADNDGDLVPESGETWKNLTFDLATGSSLVDYAVIERGTGNDGYGLGGGMIIYGQNITVSNSTIRNCSTSGDGGGIYLYPTGSGITLQNLIIYSNNASGNGGGLVIDGEAAATITGCQIYSNTASSGYGVYFLYPGSITNSLIYNHSSGQGVYISDVVTGASIRNCVIYGNSVGIYYSGTGNAVNCDVVNNTTGITTSNSVASKIVNTILWGNTTQYNVSGGSLELANCGIQGGLSGGTDGGGNKTLSATNGADTGPNFVISSSDFHLNAWITPLVDGGTPSYSGVTIPGSDIEGRARISTLDIGAYEFIYYIWTGATSTDWLTTSNWTGSPSSVPTSITDNKVIIPKGCSNYPTTSSLSLSTRSALTIEPEAGLTVTGATSVGSGCTFTLESDATGSANFITGTSVTGSYTVKLFLAGGGNPDYKWHYVTTPIDEYSKTALTTGISNSYNLLNYREDLVTTDRMAGWNWHDGYNSTPGFSTLQTKRGFDVYIATDQTATFTGTILAGSDFVNPNITCGSGDAYQRGWNLIGNPFTCATNANSYLLTAKLVDKCIYFTKDNGYAYWNTYTQAGTGFASNIVPPLQGFFVHSTGGIGSKQVTIPAASRLYTTNSLYKGAKTKDGSKSYTFPYLKLNVSDGASYTDETIVYFFNDATTSFDTDYDGFKLFSENQTYPQIYTVTESINYGMNGLPYPDKITTVPLNLRIGTANNYSINLLDIQNLDDCKVTLIKGGTRIDLKTHPVYTFYAPAGTVNDMFVEFDLSGPLDINLPPKDQAACWYSNRTVSIKTEQNGFEDNSMVVIYDINGKEVFHKTEVSLIKGEIIKIPVYLQNGIYITSVINNHRRLVKKIAVVE